MGWTWAFAGPALAALAGCGTMDVADAPRPLSVDYDFGRAQACGEGPYEMSPTRLSRRSPEIRVEGVPEGTRRLRVEMVDLDLASFDHGGGEVPAGGPGRAAAAEGALGGWIGPCPPGGSDHRYEMRVQALDAAGRPLAAGSRIRACCRRFEGG
jgi:phosphatidylethanolamine-binding protein (PEBP) family uncharacterized protein